MQSVPGSGQGIEAVIQVPNGEQNFSFIIVSILCRNNNWGITNLNKLLTTLFYIYAFKNLPWKTPITF